MHWLRNKNNNFQFTLLSKSKEEGKDQGLLRRGPYYGDGWYHFSL